jgi:hypothetical protein
MTEEVKYSAVLRDVANLVIGIEVEDTDEYVVLEKPAHVMFAPSEGGGGGIATRFIPLDLVAMQPVLLVQHIIDPDTKGEESFRVKFKKESVLKTGIQVKSDLLAGYKQSISPIEIPDRRIITPDEAANDDGKVVSLF